MSTFILGAVVCIVALTSWWSLGRLSGALSDRAIVDTPNERTIHQGSVPRGGGLVIMACLLLCLITMIVWSERPQTFAGLTILCLAWASLGWWDDRVQLSPRRRFGCQGIFSVCTLMLFGYVTEIQFAADALVILGWGGVLATLVGILWMANLYNFMDGMDGMAASQTIVAAITLAFWLQALGDWPLAICCWVLAAASYGFLLRNWHPASIFMGDVGSISLGAFFATIIIYMNTRYQVPVLCLVLLFGVFVADASVTILRRLLRKEKIWLPHRSHFYQRLALLGVNHAKIVISYTLLMILFAMLASVGFVEHDRILVVYAIGAVCMLLGMLLVSRFEAGQATSRSS